MAERTTAEKVAAIYSLARKLIEHNLAPTDNRGYVDESGLAMTMGAFLKSGGVSTSDPSVGESRGLLRRAKNLLDPTIPLLKYIPNARIGNSDRRFVQIARTQPPIALPKSEDGDDYVDYLSMEPAVPDEPLYVTTRESLEEMISYMDDRQYDRTGHRLTPRQCRHLGQTVTRFGFMHAA